MNGPLKVTKCTFNNYGPSGTVENKDGLCVLAINIINEKTFIFIWFWLVFVAVCTGLFLVFRLSTFLGKQIRVGLITIHGGKSCRYFFELIRFDGFSFDKNSFFKVNG